MPAEKVSMMKPSDTRKSNKPIMEKRRRARINNCLNELKSLILEALKKDPARHSKLEKADILEMTVKHLQTLQRQQMALAVATDACVLNKYRAGFGECVGEVSRYVSRLDGVDPSLRQRLLAHLSHYLKNLHGMGDSAPVTLSSLATSHLQMPSPSSDSIHFGSFSNSSPQDSSNFFRGLQLIPTRLPTGEIVFLLPSQSLASTALGTFSGTSPPKISSPSSVTPPQSTGLLSLSKPFSGDAVSPAIPSTVTKPPMGDKETFRSSMIPSPEERCLESPDMKFQPLEDPSSPMASVAQDLTKKLRVDTSEEMDLSAFSSSASSSSSSSCVEAEHSPSPSHYAKELEDSGSVRDPWRPW